jgi:hypothetical protein
MASTYVNDLRLNELATGDASGTWGTITNTNLELVAEAFSFGTEGITTNADTHTSTIADGATDPVRSMYVKYTGTLDSACTITIAPNTVSKLWFIENGTSGSQNIIISQGTGANVTIPAGDTKVLYSDGAGSGAAVVDAFASLSTVDLKVQDDLTVTDDVIVNGDIDLEGSIDVNGTSNLDVVDIDGALTQDGGAVFNEDSADVDFRVESNGQTHALFVDGALDNIGIGYSAAHTATNKGLVILTGDGNGGIQFNKEDGSYPSSGETLGSIGWKGADSANNNAAAGASIVGIAAEDFSGSTEATNLAFNTKPSGTGPGSAPSERMRIDSSGNIGFGLTSPTFSSGNGMHFADAFKAGFGTGNGTRPDFQISGDNNGLAFACGTGSDDADVLITTAGNVGIGITSVAAELHVNETNAGGLGGRMLIQNNSSTSGSYCQLILAPTAATAADRCVVIQAENTDGNNNQAMVFKTSEGSSPAERMRVTPNGILVVGASAAFTSGGTNSGAGQLCVASNNATAVHFKRANGNGGLVNFIRGGVTNPVGSISIDASNTSFNTSSDARLKNVLGEAKGLEIINKLNPINFEWKESKNVQDGLIAQEVAELIPHAVSQNDSGYYQMDYSKLVTPLIKAIQEQQTQIEALQSKINTLKGGD